ncbi:MAG: hypothetical protein STSR0004_10950 [Peptococcaceae bacterium]
MDDIKSGHRQRLRNKFIENPSALNETELLELMLTYAIPRKDVKPLAAELIINFGSLSSVLAADTGDLCKTKGVNEYTAACLKLVAWVGENYSTGQKTVSPPVQDAAKEFLPAEDTEQSTKPVITPTLEHLGSLFAEEGALFAEKTFQSAAHMFSKSLLREAIEILPRIPYSKTTADIRTFLINNLHYNSVQSRMRYTSYITRRLFPSRQVETPIFSFSRKYAGRQELRDVCFYLFYKAEPLMWEIIENLLIPELRSGGFVTRSNIRSYLQVKYPEAKSHVDCAQAIVETLVAAGVARADRTKIHFAYRDILLPSLAFILHSEFPAGMYYLNEVEDCSAFKCLFWRQNQVKESLYALRNMNLIPKISEIDNLSQVTISLDLDQVVERLEGRSPL